MEGIGGGIGTRFTPIDDDATAGDGFLSFGVAHLGNCDRGRYTHDGRGDEVLGGNAETDVCDQD